MSRATDHILPSQTDEAEARAADRRADYLSATPQARLHWGRDDRLRNALPAVVRVERKEAMTTVVVWSEEPDIDQERLAERILVEAVHHVVQATTDA